MVELFCHACFSRKQSEHRAYRAHAEKARLTRKKKKQSELQRYGKKMDVSGRLKDNIDKFSA